jgi:hypothetical protein
MECDLMANEKPAARVEGGISPTAIAWFVIGGGFLLLGWKLLTTLSAGSKTAQDLSRSIQEEAQEAQAYVSGGAYTEDGLEIRKIALEDKIIALKTVSTSWLERTLNVLAGWLRTFGIYVVWPTVGLLGIYVIYKCFVKNWPNQPPTLRCTTDGLVFSTEEQLAQHNATAHQGTSDTASLHTAQAIFLTQLSYVQDVVAVQYIYPEKVQGDWGWLTPLEVIGLKTAIEVVIGYGIGSGMSSLVPYLVIF